jgi:hypothetical protein
MGMQLAMQRLAPLKSRETPIPTDDITILGVYEGLKGESV